MTKRNPTEVYLPPHVVNEKDPPMPMSQTVDWGTNVLNIPTLHEMGLTGEGIRVAVIDTGIDKEHPDLKGGIAGIVNTTREAMSATHGHGIGAAGIIGARNNTRGILGTAPECQILGIKSMRETGGGSISEIVDGIEAAMALEVDVINLSLGTTADVPSLKSVIKEAIQEGIYVVCSAGNSGGDDTVVYPARYTGTFAVGATNQSGKVSAFSSRGTQVDIAAPGERVLTTWKNKSYARVSGTSFSAPYVSGLFALFKQADILVNHTRLEATAIDIEEPGKDKKSGWGLINPIYFVDKYAPKEDGEQPTNDTTEDIDLTPVFEAFDSLKKFVDTINKHFNQ